MRSLGSSTLLPLLLLSASAGAGDRIAASKPSTDAIAAAFAPTTSTTCDPSETFNVTISNIPAGSTLIYDGVAVAITGGSATIVSFDATKSLAIQPPAHSNTDFSLSVSAVSIDTLGAFTSTSLPTTLSIAVDVRGADLPIITAVPLVTTEAAVDGGARRIPLSSIMTSTALTDSDGSETLSFVLSGLPAGVTIEGLTFTGGAGAARIWAGTAAEYASAQNVVLADTYSGSFAFQFRAITTENDGNSLTGNWVTVPVQVTPSPEATINAMTTASEDTLTRVDFALQIQNGDSNETLSSVWINAAACTCRSCTYRCTCTCTYRRCSCPAEDGLAKAGRYGHCCRNRESAVCTHRVRGARCNAGEAKPRGPLSHGPVGGVLHCREGRFPGS